MPPVGMHLLLDQGLPRDAASNLRSSGVQSTHVGEIGMSRASDTEIIAWAESQGFVVVTLDADFHAILAVQHASRPSAIRIRLQGLDGQAIAELLRTLLVRYSSQIEEGCMLTVKRHKTTCHLLTK